MTKKLKDAQVEQADGGVIYRTETAGMYEVYNESTGELLNRTRSIKLAGLTAKDNEISTEIITHEMDPDFRSDMKKLRRKLKNNK